MLDNLRQCFGLANRRDNQASAWVDLESGADGLSGDSKPGCVFCHVSAEKGFSVIESLMTGPQDHEMTAFRDRNPGAQHHILIIPKRHISTVKDLRPEDVPLLSRMEAMGVRLLSEYGYPPEKQKLGYHIPPFSSVHHIHLHALSLPLKSWWRRLKYRSTTPRDSKHLLHGEDGGKRWGWFVSSQDAIAILRSGRTIGIGSL